MPRRAGRVVGFRRTASAPAARSRSGSRPSRIASSRRRSASPPPPPPPPAPPGGGAEGGEPQGERVAATQAHDSLHAIRTPRKEMDAQGPRGVRGKAPEGQLERRGPARHDEPVRPLPRGHEDLHVTAALDHEPEDPSDVRGGEDVIDEEEQAAEIRKKNRGEVDRVEPAAPEKIPKPGPAEARGKISEAAREG